MSAARTRSTAEKRRAVVLTVALAEFAEGGLHGTSTEAIARRAGISHAYLFRLFATKRQLFIACARECFRRVEATFAAAAVGEEPAERLGSIGDAYRGLLADRELLLFQMQLYAACSDEEIREVARAGLKQLVEDVGRLSGTSGVELQEFFAMAMLLNVAASMDCPALGERSCW